MGRLASTARAGADAKGAIAGWIATNKDGGKPGAEVAQALDALRLRAGDDLDALRAGIEAWYDGAMERVSGLYKRWTQGTSIAIGFAVSGALDIDSARLFRAFCTQPALRAAAADCAARKGEGADAPAGRDAARQLMADLTAFSAPLGWDAGVDWSAAGLAAMALGWALSALALSLGAAFWFDILKRVVNLRASGTKPGGAAQRVVSRT